MKKTTGFITLQRQIQDWQWYRHPHTAFLFIHLLLSANYVDGQFNGMTIRRGQLVTSVPRLSTDTGLSIQQTKTALAHLRLTGEITDESTNQYRVITVVKYNQYQKLTDKISNDQPTTNRQNLQRLTDDSSNDQPQYNNNNNITINKKTINQDYVGKTAQRFIPPTKQEIDIFCLENGLSIDVDYFYDHYASNGWMVGKNKMKDWQATVRNWARRDKGSGSAPVSPGGPKPVNPKPPARPSSAANFEQRDYSGVPDQMMDDLEDWVAREREAGNL